MKIMTGKMLSNVGANSCVSAPDRLQMKIKDEGLKSKFRELADSLGSNMMTFLFNKLIELFFDLPLIFDKNPLRNFTATILFMQMLDKERLDSIHQLVREEGPLTMNAKKSQVLASMASRGIELYIREKGYHRHG